MIISWQIVPKFLSEKMTKGEPARVQNMMTAMQKMKKLEVAELERAYNE